MYEKLRSICNDVNVASMLVYVIFSLNISISSSLCVVTRFTVLIISLIANSMICGAGAVTNRKLGTTKYTIAVCIFALIYQLGKLI